MGHCGTGLQAAPIQCKALYDSRQGLPPCCLPKAGPSMVSVRRVGGGVSPAVRPLTAARASRGQASSLAVPSEDKLRVVDMQDGMHLPLTYNEVGC